MDKIRVDTHTQTHVHTGGHKAMAIPKGQNWPQVKTDQMSIEFKCRVSVFRVKFHRGCPKHG